eukprot:gene13799-4036_t
MSPRRTTSPNLIAFTRPPIHVGSPNPLHITAQDQQLQSEY